ncbi:MAG: hypothetical protein KF857_12460 [Fimbriimonadaceae bacterium]|nr:hypothetical protein [Fimbriimonadaceae bacterium]
MILAVQDVKVRGLAIWGLFPCAQVLTEAIRFALTHVGLNMFLSPLVVLPLAIGVVEGLVFVRVIKWADTKWARLVFALVLWSVAIALAFNLSDIVVLRASLVSISFEAMFALLSAGIGLCLTAMVGKFLARPA